jgi:hypothetical protein
MRLLIFLGNSQGKELSKSCQAYWPLNNFQLNIVLQTQPTALKTLISLTAALVSGDAATGDSGDCDYLGS